MKPKSKRTVAEWQTMVDEKSRRVTVLWLALSDTITGRSVKGDPVTVAVAAGETDGVGRMTATILRPLSPCGGIVVVRQGDNVDAYYAEEWSAAQPGESGAYALLRERVRVALYRAQRTGA